MRFEVYAAPDDDGGRPPWRDPTPEQLQRADSAPMARGMNMALPWLPRPNELRRVRLLLRRVCLRCGLLRCAEHSTPLRLDPDGGRVQLVVRDARLLDALLRPRFADGSSVRDLVARSLVHHLRIEDSEEDGAARHEVLLAAPPPAHLPGARVEEDELGWRASFDSREEAQAFRDDQARRGLREPAELHVSHLPPWGADACRCCGAPGLCGPERAQGALLTFRDAAQHAAWRVDHPDAPRERSVAPQHGQLLVQLEAAPRAAPGTCPCCARPGVHLAQELGQARRDLGDVLLRFQSEEDRQAWREAHPEIREVRGRVTDRRWIFGPAELHGLLHSMRDAEGLALDALLFTRQFVVPPLRGCPPRAAGLVLAQARRMDRRRRAVDGQFLVPMPKKRPRLQEEEEQVLAARAPEGSLVAPGDALARFADSRRKPLAKAVPRLEGSGVYELSWLRSDGTPADDDAAPAAAQLREVPARRLVRAPQGAQRLVPVGAQVQPGQLLAGTARAPCAGTLTAWQGPDAVVTESSAEAARAEPARAAQACIRQRDLARELFQAVMGRAKAPGELRPARPGEQPPVSALETALPLQAGKAERAAKGSARFNAEQNAQLFVPGIDAPLVSVSSANALALRELLELPPLDVWGEELRDALERLRRGPRIYPGAQLLIAHAPEDQEPRVHRLDAAWGLAPRWRRSSRLELLEEILRLRGGVAAGAPVEAAAAQLALADRAAGCAALWRALADPELLRHELLLLQIRDFCRRERVRWAIVHPRTGSRYYVVRNPVDHLGSVQCITLHVTPGTRRGAGFSALLLVNMGMDHDGDLACFRSVLNSASAALLAEKFGPERHLVDPAGRLQGGLTKWPLAAWAAVTAGPAARLTRADALVVLSAAGGAAPLPLDADAVPPCDILAALLETLVPAHYVLRISDGRIVSWRDASSPRRRFSLQRPRGDDVAAAWERLAGYLLTLASVRRTARRSAPRAAAAGEPLPLPADPAELVRDALQAADRRALLGTCRRAAIAQRRRQLRLDSRTARTAWPWLRMRVRALAATNMPGLCKRTVEDILFILRRDFADPHVAMKFTTRLQLTGYKLSLLLRARAQAPLEPGVQALAEAGFAALNRLVDALPAPELPRQAEASAQLCHRALAPAAASLVRCIVRGRPLCAPCHSCADCRRLARPVHGLAARLGQQ